MSKFKQSINEIKSTKTLTVVSILIATNILMAPFAIKLGELVKISLNFIPNSIIGYIGGPFMAGMAGIVSDVTEFMVKPDSTFMFMFTGIAVVSGLIYGNFLYKQKVSLQRVSVCCTVHMLVVNLFLNSLGLKILYGTAFWALMPTRIVKNVIALPFEIFLTYIILKKLESMKLVK